jgi:alpha-tubulin suppressor-like RCC1 family protein
MLAPYTLHRDSKLWDGIYKVQISSTSFHVAAVTKAGQLFTWSSRSQGCLTHNNIHCNELWPKRVEHGGVAELFIVCATAGFSYSAAIDSSRLLPIFCFSIILDIATLQLFLIFACVIFLMDH